VAQCSTYRGLHCYMDADADEVNSHRHV
jgi:hypothetical protein